MQEHPFNTIEVLHIIFSYCAIETVIKASEVTLHWNRVINQKSFWRILTERDIHVIVKPKREKARKHNVPLDENSNWRELYKSSYLHRHPNKKKQTEQKHLQRKLDDVIYMSRDRLPVAISKMSESIP